MQNQQSSEASPPTQKYLQPISSYQLPDQFELEGITKMCLEESTNQEQLQSGFNQQISSFSFGNIQDPLKRTLFHIQKSIAGQRSLFLQLQKLQKTPSKIRHVE